MGRGKACSGQRTDVRRSCCFFLTPAISFTFQSRVLSLLRYVLFLVALVLIVMANAKTAWILTPAYMLLIGVATRLKRFARRDATMLAVACGLGVVIVAVTVPDRVTAGACRFWVRIQALAGGFRCGVRPCCRC